jgi:hypothetical protein
LAAINLLTDYLRLITPEEISELTTAYAGNSRVELTELLEHVSGGSPLEFGEDAEGAKILPFVNKTNEVLAKSDDELANEVSAGPNVIEFVAHFLHVVSLGETSRGSSGEAVETSTFIINEKERFKYAQEKMKQKEIMSLYMKNALVDIEQEKTLKDDLSKSSQVGVLVNKKQF